MNSKLGMLLLKECRERRTQLLISLAWMTIGAAQAVAYERAFRFRAPIASYFSAASLFGLLFPIFIAMRTALGESTDGTRSFTSMLPVRATLRGIIRFAGGAMVLALSMIVGALLVAACLSTGLIEQATARSDSLANIQLLNRPTAPLMSALGMLGTVALVCLCSTLTLYGILCVIGTTMRREAHAGFASVVVVLLWLLSTAVVADGVIAEDSRWTRWIHAASPGGMAINYGYGHIDGGSYGDLYIVADYWRPLAINLAVQTALALCFVRRYSRKLSAPGRVRVRRYPRRARSLWLPAFRFPSVSLVWLTLRQAVPMAIPGLILACLMTPFQMDMHEAPMATKAEAYVASLSSSMWIIGVLWSIVVGAGLFAGEVDRRSAETWRALPIRIGDFFSIKYLVGLFTVLIVLDGTIIIANWKSPSWGSYYSMNWMYIACFVPFHAVMYSIAVAACCVLRRPVIAGMLTLLLFFILPMSADWFPVLAQFDVINTYNHLAQLESRGEPLSLWDSSYPMLAALMGLTIVASAVIGGYALRRYELSWFIRSLSRTSLQTVMPS